MKNKLFSNLAIVAVVVLFMTGCQSAPEQEKLDAIAAVEATKTSGAELYATEGFAALQDSLKAAIEGIEVENSNFFKDFTKSKEQLAAIIAASQTVTAAAIANKEAIKTEATALIAEVTAMIAANNQLITEAPKGKEGKTALLAIQAENDALVNATTEASTLLTAENFIGARDTAKSAKDKATAINTELQDVISKTAAAKKK